jgi:hypothetical protein
VFLTLRGEFFEQSVLRVQSPRLIHKLTHDEKARVRCAVSVHSSWIYTDNTA